MKRGKWNVLAVLAIGTISMALTGSQCSRVSDRLTAPTSSEAGVGFERVGSGVAACVQICNEEARNARAVERDLHKSNISACKLLSGSAKENCLSAEGVRHEARMEEISMDMEACKAPCHEQGSGSGGQ